MKFVLALVLQCKGLLCRSILHEENVTEMFYFTTTKDTSTYKENHFVQHDTNNDVKGNPGEDVVTDYNVKVNQGKDVVTDFDVKGNQGKDVVTDRDEVADVHGITEVSPTSSEDDTTHDTSQRSNTMVVSSPECGIHVESEDNFSTDNTSISNSDNVEDTHDTTDICFTDSQDKSNKALLFAVKMRQHLAFKVGKSLNTYFFPIVVPIGFVCNFLSLFTLLRSKSKRCIHVLFGFVRQLCSYCPELGMGNQQLP